MTKWKETEIGRIPEEWVLKKLKDLFEISVGGDLSKISFSKNKTKEYKYPIYSNSLNNGGLYGFSKSYQYEPGCVTITARGDVGKAECRKDFFCAIVRLLVLKPKCDISCRFVANFINSRLDFLHVGSAVNQLTAPIISDRLIAIPPFPEQKAIAKILSDLDSKIELNNQMNATLEAMAQAIFKQWFIDFEFPDENGKPYKSNGGKMVDSELGKIPEGWQISRIGEELHTVLGGTPSTDKKEYWTNGTIPWINSGKINEFPIVSPSDYITTKGLESSSTKIMPIKTVVLPLVISVGKPINISILGIETCGNQSVLGIVGNDKLPLEFLYYWILNMKNEIYSWATGGAQQHINKNNVDETPIIIPPKEILAKYLTLVDNLFDKIIENSNQNINLSDIRDSLLPKLMSGQIRVPLEVIKNA